MGSRRRARELAIKVLFHLEFTPGDPAEVFQLICENFGSSKSIRSFSRELVLGVCTNKKELDQCLSEIAEKELQTLDFFSVVRYHLIREDKKRVPLKFDYHVLRFNFQGELNLQIRHEKGPQRVPLDDLTDFLIKQINSELARRQLNLIFLGDFEKVSLR